MTGSFISLRENPFRTHARSIEDVSQTSTGSLKYRHCRCSPPSHPFPFSLQLCFLFHPLPPPVQCSSTSFVSPPCLLYNWKEASENALRQDPPLVHCRRDRDHSGEIDTGFLSRCSIGSSMSLVIIQKDTQQRREKGGE